MPSGKPSKAHHCPGMKKMRGNCRKKGKTPISRLLYCLVHQCYCPVCAASSINEDHPMLRASDSCPNGCGYKHPDHKDNVKARDEAEKKAKKAAKDAKAKNGLAKVAAQQAAAVQKN
ncbi:hypothetical protein BOTCAL_0096g00250 [Botryotinia calthae]|uniref:Uncharacterized protein n=1 Tax=Botryotinia calthae TaxID=38488 RepID=A0A4Y8D6K9_9HELO|nr:hypothetical protein BOTCAL_0096g00250 [Botryotinia calthae]